MSPVSWVSRCLIGYCLLCGVAALAQETEDVPVTPKEPGTTNTATDTVGNVQQKAEDVVDDAKQKVDEFAKDVDQSPQAKQITAGILQPIYLLAEQLSFPWFHWLAFALMSTGVVSYALQLVLGKLIVLAKMGFSPKEILSDAHGLIVSLIGLVLTTQASAENSTFTQSPFAVLSAAATGLVVGFIFYRWGQAQEVQAAVARRGVSTW